MDLTYQQKAEKMTLNLPVYADGVGAGAIAYCFDGEVWQWWFGKSGGVSFLASNELVEKAVEENKHRISREWNLY